MKTLSLLIINLLPFISLSGNTIPTSIWNLKENPSFSLEQMNNIYCLYENKYFLKVWNTKMVGLAIERKFGTVAFELSRNGNSSFSNNLCYSSFSKALSPKLSMGLGLACNYISQKEIKNTPTFFSPSFGFSYLVNENNKVYSSIKNNHYQSNNSGRPNSFLFLWQNEITTQLTMNFEFEHSLSLNIYKCSFNAFIKKNLQFSLGLNTSETPIDLAFSIPTKKLNLLIKSSYHQKLGSSNQIGICYLW